MNAEQHYIDRILTLEARVEQLEDGIDRALHELGEPQPGYPAPVANAVDILRAFGVSPEVRTMNDERMPHWFIREIVKATLSRPTRDQVIAARLWISGQSGGVGGRAYSSIIEGEIDALEARVRELEEPLRWLVNLHHGVGKRGGPPESGEWEDAIEQGKAALAPTQRPT